MLRGRRVVFFVVFFLYIFLFQTTTNATEIGVTATVTLSPVWKKAIEERSTVTLDTVSHENIAFFEVTTKGVEDIIVPNETIQILFFKENRLISSQIKTTNKQGNAEFTFVYTKGSAYRAICVNIGHEFPFIIKTLSFAP